MARDDSHLNFEKALAGQVRSSAVSRSSAEEQRDPCPDAELLAAFHERSLSTEEWNTWKTHIAACSRCRQILAHIETTESIPLFTAAEENVVVMTPAARASQQSARLDAGLAATAKSASSLRLYRGASWRWLAPAGAIAASLIVWIAWHETRIVPPARPSATEVSENRQASPPLPETRPAPNASALSDEISRVQNAESNAISNGKLASKHNANESPVTSAENIAPRQKPAASTLNQRDVAANEPARTGELRARNQSGSGARAAGATTPQALPPPAPATNVVAPPPPPLAKSPAPQLPQPEPAAGLSETVTFGQPGPADAKKQAMKESKVGVAGGAVSQFDRAPSLQLAAVLNSNQVAAPGGRVFWRLGPSGLIERSTDGGIAWKKQSSGVTADLLAGSAPSAKVCWVVGRDGTILRTTDGGAHWIAIAFVSTDAFDGVQAADALHASVSSATAQKTLETSDGGVTWKLVAKE